MIAIVFIYAITLISDGLQDQLSYEPFGMTLKKCKEKCNILCCTLFIFISMQSLSFQLVVCVCLVWYHLDIDQVKNKPPMVTVSSVHYPPPPLSPLDCSPSPYFHVPITKILTRPLQKKSGPGRFIFHSPSVHCLFTPLGRGMQIIGKIS